jgi:twinkle protein
MLPRAEIFARKLGVGRTLIVGPAAINSVADDEECPKDANALLLQNGDLLGMLQRAAHVPHEQIVGLHALREEVMLYLRDPHTQAGIPYTTMPGLNALQKGHRRGEFSVLTGPTGVGKTTLLMQLSLDLAAQGIRTLWGSFEISNSRLVSQMFTQFNGGTAAAEALLSCGDSTSFNEAWEDFCREIPVGLAENSTLSAYNYGGVPSSIMIMHR